MTISATGARPISRASSTAQTEPSVARSQLTGDGFGYALEDGTYANPFFADFLSPETYLEFFSAPPFGPGTGPEDSELPMDFTGSVAALDGDQ